MAYTLMADPMCVWILIIKVFINVTHVVGKDKSKWGIHNITHIYNVVPHVCTEAYI